MSHQRLATLLRREFAREAGDSFPHLRHVPYTHVIAFLDYFDSLDTAERESLLDAMASSAAVTVGGRSDSALALKEYQQRDSPLPLCACSLPCSHPNTAAATATPTSR
jgi:hypothetical protein